MLPSSSFADDQSSGSYDDGLTRGSPSEAGVDAAAIEAFLDDVKAAGLEVHSLMLHRRERVVAEAWWWPYRAAEPRIMHSLAKSFTACAVGFAVADGLISLRDKVVSFFPDDLPEVVDEKLAAMTVEDLLTMRTGHASEVGGPVWRGINTSWIAEFFRIPILSQPGDVYMYSSSSSYMLAAIVFKVTGQTLHDYLKPRLFEPLGITGETWDLGPDGFNPGGNGLTCTTADILKFGALHAQQGMWEGKQLLPKAWIDVSTREHVRHAEGGYGYHWVTFENGSYGALGMFVQMVLVYPDHQASLALTCAIDGSQKILPYIDRHFPGAFKDEAFDGAAADASLKVRLAGLREEAPLPSVASPLTAQISGRSYCAEANPMGVTQVSFDFSEGRCVLRLTDAEGEHSVTAGLGAWIAGTADIPGRDLHHGYRLAGAEVVAGARWADPATLEVIWTYTGSAFRDTAVCRFDGAKVTIERSVNINSSARAWPAFSASTEA